jgi:carbon starvation protein CstA
VPMAFVATITLWAGYLSIRDNFWPLTMAPNPSVRVQGYVDAICTGIMMVLVVVILASALHKWYMVLSGRERPARAAAQGA